ncbi:S9 family peptidase [Colwellia sp. E2M01]|uniref:S9 family peptidase n=1 Tax=Colwellia sp. E2M01 TaxID=2841561 RepID=UPI001C08E636|nr:S9 family peptidase [Colwellia sp. E2M01]MBU2871853.1 S9 family peptidase [Colwellia sp. E2M01]
MYKALIALKNTVNFQLSLVAKLSLIYSVISCSNVIAEQLNTTKQSTTLFTAEKLATLQSIRQAQVSPSGEFVAFIRSVPREIYIEKNGKNWSELYLVDNHGKERAFVTGKVNINNIQWSADGSLIYFLAKMKNDEFTALYQIAVDGGQAQQAIALKDTNISQYTVNRDNSKIALLAKKAKDKSVKKLKELGFKAEVFEEELSNQFLYVININPSDKSALASNKSLSPQAWDIKGSVSAVRFSPNGSDLLVKTQPTPLIDDKYMKSKWHIVDIASQEIKTTFVTEGKLGAAEFSYDGKYVALLGAQDQHDPALGRLYIANANSGNVANWLPNFNGHVSDFEWANSRNELLFIADIGTQSIIANIKPGSSDYTTVIDVGSFIASNLSISDSDKTVAIRGNTAQHPNEVFLLRGTQHARLTYSNAWLTDLPLAKQESITIQARDGIEVGGVLVYPLNYKEGQRYPLIMSVHGGPESHVKDGWLTGYASPGQLAAAQDYLVFYPNYRGSTGQGVNYSKLGQNDYAGKEFDDLVDLKNHLVNIGLADEKKVGITGGSYGGYAAAWGATKLTKHFAASVMFVGIANQLSKFGTTDIPNEMHLVHARSYPWEKWQWYLERSPIYWAKQSKTPLLIMHGKADPRVHPAQSLEMYRYMKVHGKTVRLVYYPDEGHGNKRAAAKYDYNLRLMRWMDNYLKHGNKTMPSPDLPHQINLKQYTKASVTEHKESTTAD